ncbi:hypothetical protein C8J57DRAFT_1272748, partial [Mycena rebaudengoi]
MWMEGEPYPRRIDLGNATAARLRHLLRIISPDILQGQNTEADNYVRAEIYKFNDTPRREDMIGSLVVIFPTAHAGGALTLEHDGTAWTFDSATQLAAAISAPAFAY